MRSIVSGIAQGFAYLWRAGSYLTRYAVSLVTGRIEEVPEPPEHDEGNSLYRRGAYTAGCLTHGEIAPLEQLRPSNRTIEWGKGESLVCTKMDRRGEPCVRQVLSEASRDALLYVDRYLRLSSGVSTPSCQCRPPNRAMGCRVRFSMHIGEALGM